MTKQGETIVVGMGEMRVSTSQSAVLTCLGLGSCIAVCVYDPVNRVGGMAHVVLPHYDGRDGGPSAKYADTAVPLLVQEVRKHGVSRSLLIVKIAGGAQVSLVCGVSSLFKTGERNTLAVKDAVSKEGMALRAAEIGGYHGRTVRMHVDSGKVVVTSAGMTTREL